MPRLKQIKKPFIDKYLTEKKEKEAKQTGLEPRPSSGCFPE